MPPTVKIQFSLEDENRRVLVLRCINIVAQLVRRQPQLGLENNGGCGSAVLEALRGMRDAGYQNGQLKGIITVHEGQAKAVEGSQPVDPNSPHGHILRRVNEAKRRASERIS